MASGGGRSAEVCSRGDPSTRCNRNERMTNQPEQKDARLGEAPEVEEGTDGGAERSGGVSRWWPWRCRACRLRRHRPQRTKDINLYSMVPRETEAGEAVCGIPQATGRREGW